MSHDGNEPAAPREESKPIHSLVLDTGPIVKNDPPDTVLRSRTQQLYTTPAIISEIRDAATRSRVEITLLPFVTIRSPKPESIRFVTGFARKTGDLDVLSRPDIEILALGYELECERNGGDWRLRNVPGQPRLNGRPNKERADLETQSAEKSEDTEGPAPVESEENGTHAEGEGQGENVGDGQALQQDLQDLHLEPQEEHSDEPEEIYEAEKNPKGDAHDRDAIESNEDGVQTTEETTEKAFASDEPEDDSPDRSSEDDDDGEGDWITPSNLKKHQAKQPGTSTPSQPVQKTLQAAVLTSDYAMQNVALRMNLNIVAPSLSRITHIKTWVMRCHGCFHVTKDTARQFCPSCGQPTLMRASCSTDENGNFRVHLKKNFQWKNRGNVYSVPKPVHGSTNGRLPKKNASGGQNGWGQGLILAEDQKEYTRALEEKQRAKKKDMMDQDLLPGILSGNRSSGGSKIRVGAGRSVNSRRKHK